MGSRGGIRVKLFFITVVIGALDFKKYMVFVGESPKFPKF